MLSADSTQLHLVSPALSTHKPPTHLLQPRPSLCQPRDNYSMRSSFYHSLQTRLETLVARGGGGELIERCSESSWPRATVYSLSLSLSFNTKLCGRICSSSCAAAQVECRTKKHHYHHHHHLHTHTHTLSLSLSLFPPLFSQAMRPQQQQGILFPARYPPPMEWCGRDMCTLCQA